MRHAWPTLRQAQLCGAMSAIARVDRRTGCAIDGRRRGRHATGRPQRGSGQRVRAELEPVEDRRLVALAASALLGQVRPFVPRTVNELLTALARLRPAIRRPGCGTARAPSSRSRRTRRCRRRRPSGRTCAPAPSAAQLQHLVRRRRDADRHDRPGLAVEQPGRLRGLAVPQAGRQQRRHPRRWPVTPCQPVAGSRVALTWRGVPSSSVRVTRLTIWPSCQCSVPWCS